MRCSACNLYQRIETERRQTMKSWTSSIVMAIVLVSLPAVAPSWAQSRMTDEAAFEESFDDQQRYQDAEPELEYAQDAAVRIEPSEAAAIAQDAVPGSMVLKVRLLSSGVYAVTLKSNGSVVRVMVSAEDGSIQ